ncbi:MAG: hypothetical protein ACPL7I_09195 [Myxococcota bacterium]
MKRRRCRMPKKMVTETEKENILKKVRREFPGCKSLQDIHYYRYLKEIEWETMTPAEIVKDIKEGSRRIKKGMKRLTTR